MSDHPTSDELAGLGRGEVSPERSREIAVHLLQGCQSCLRTVLRRTGCPLPGEGTEASPTQEAEYDAVIDRVFATVRKAERQRLRERALTRNLVALLEEQGIEALYHLKPRQAGLPLIEALLERSQALRNDKPGKMVELAEYAALALRRLEVRNLPPERVADIRCRVWAELGNAYRAADDLAQAELAFERAMEEYLRGSRDKLLAARLFDLLGSYHGTCRQLGLACSFLRRAASLYRLLHDGHMEGRALITRGIYTGYAGQPEKAIQLLSRGLEMVDERREPGLVFTGMHNRIAFLVECGRLGEAQKLYFLNRRRARDAPGRVSQLKFRWLEGQIDAGLGRLKRAEGIFRDTVRDLNKEKMGYHSALAALDLSEAILRQGRTQEAREIVVEAARVFAALKIHREALAAVLFLQDCFVQGTAPAAKLEELLAEVIAFLRRAERDPKARFDPPVL